MKRIANHLVVKFLMFVSISSCFISISCIPSKDLTPNPTTPINSELSAGLLGNWDELGIQRNQPVPDFTLYSEDGKAFNLTTELQKGSPIVLINASYTCDVSRANLREIKSIERHFGEDARFFMIYTIEAHPFDVASPYSAEGKIWISPNNVRANVKAKQPKTYEQRVNLARRWMNENTIDFTVLVDNPDNFYWKKFGQAPNMVYVISPSQTVLYKQAWFNKEKLALQLESLREDQGQ